MRFTLTRLKTALWKLNGAVLPGGVVIQSVWGGSGAVVQARTPAAGINIMILHQGKFVGMGEEMTPGSALLMPPGSISLTHTPGEYGCYSIFIPAELAKSVGSLRFLVEKSRQDAHVVHDDPATSVPVVNRLEEFFSNFDMERGILPNQTSLLDFRDEVFVSLKHSYRSQAIASGNGRGRPLRANEHALGRALDVVEHQKLGKTVIADLTRAAKVSDTRLRAAFHRYLGLSPSEFIRLRRLNLIWLQLNYSHTRDTSIARILADCRISDMGRFARRYRRIFGENPSKTLQRESQVA